MSLSNHRRTWGGSGSWQVRRSPRLAATARPARKLESPYRHSPGILANFGYHVARRVDIGAEVFWIPMDTPQGQINVTHIDGVVQFRPWASQGFSSRPAPAWR